MKIIFIVFSIIPTCCLLATGRDTHVYPVTEYGAKGDGQTINTKAIQAAIDATASGGGGVVLFSPGQYVSGSIILYDYVTLRFETGAILLGSFDLKDYPEDLGVLPIANDYIWRGPLIYAENARHIAIEGYGIIDGRGSEDRFPPFPRSNHRPGLIRFKDCKFVRVQGISLRDAACWTFHLRNCEDVIVRDITIDSYVNRNNDGIDVDGCRRVSITGCNIRSEDDAIVLKSFTREKVSDIVIANCILSSSCSAIKIGTETVGDFENISISNCAIYGSRGINLFSVDGSDVNNVIITNISLRDCKSVIQLRLGDRLRPYELPGDQQPIRAGRIRNIMISRVQATGVQESQDFISGIPCCRIENVDLSDVRISYRGSGTRQQALLTVPEETKAYPKIGMFGDLPSYGFFIRHVDGIRLHNIRLDVLTTDAHPALFFDDVFGVNMSDCLLEANHSKTLIRLNSVIGAVIRDTRMTGEADTFVGITGKASKDIILKDNFHTKVKKTIECDKEVEGNVVKEL